MNGRPAAWLRVAVADRDAGIWVRAATTGARRSELAGVEVDLPDLEMSQLEFRHTRVVLGGQAVDSDGKSDSGNRIVSLDAFTVAYLRRHVAVLARERGLSGKDHHRAGKLLCHWASRIGCCHRSGSVFAWHGPPCPAACCGVLATPVATGGRNSRRFGVGAWRSDGTDEVLCTLAA